MQHELVQIFGQTRNFSTQRVIRNETGKGTDLVAVRQVEDVIAAGFYHQLSFLSSCIKYGGFRLVQRSRGIICTRHACYIFC